MNGFAAWSRSFAGRLARKLTRSRSLADPQGVSLNEALQRIRSKGIEVGSFVNIGAGQSLEVARLGVYWPRLHSLLIDMDSRFVEGWQELARRHPGVNHIICAAGREDSVGHFSKTNDVGGALVEPADGAPGSHATPIRKIDSLVTEFGLPGPYFLKFDTHGVELDVLAGASQTLMQTSLIMMEVYNFKLNFVGQRNFTFDEMSLHMKSLGFRCVDICDPLFRPKDKSLWQFHMFFIRSDHPVWQSNGYS